MYANAAKALFVKRLFLPSAKADGNYIVTDLKLICIYYRSL